MSDAWRPNQPRQIAMVIVTAVCVCCPVPVRAQDSVTSVLSFLLTNRSIPTDDFQRDEEAAAASRDAITVLLLSELGMLPVASPASGFTYRPDQTLGTSVRSSENFGPFFLERSLTAGRRQASFGLAFRNARFDSIDGRDLSDGSLVSTAARLQGELEPFDVETVELRLEAATVTFSAHLGVTDRLEIGAALPFVRLTLDGRRIDTYRGVPSLQATAFGSASGVGDAILRAKYNVARFGASGVSAAAEIRLPTGSERNLLGSGETTIKPQLIASVERGAFGIHGDFGYTFLSASEVIDYGAAATVAASARLTIVGELIGRRVSALGRLVEATDAHPTLAGVDTIRLTSLAEPTSRLLLVAGVKWNLAATWLLGASILRPLTSSGLNAEWMPTVTFDYSF
jgi:Putative MetA-pathway of phenol degradation